MSSFISLGSGPSFCNLPIILMNLRRSHGTSIWYNVYLLQLFLFGFLSVKLYRLLVIVHFAPRLHFLWALQLLIFIIGLLISQYIHIFIYRLLIYITRSAIWNPLEWTWGTKIIHKEKREYKKIMLPRVGDWSWWDVEEQSVRNILIQFSV